MYKVLIEGCDPLFLPHFTIGCGQKYYKSSKFTKDCHHHDKSNGNGIEKSNKNKNDNKFKQSQLNFTSSSSDPSKSGEIKDVCYPIYDKNRIWHQKRDYSKLTKIANDLCIWDDRIPIVLTHYHRDIDNQDDHDDTIIIDLNNHSRYLSFEKQQEIIMIDNLQNKSLAVGNKNLNLIDCTNDNKTIKLIDMRQRSPWWFKEREKKVTGSKLTNIFGFWGLSKFWTTWFDCYDPDNPILKEIISSYAESDREIAKGKECMAWGTFHENDGLATVIHHLGNKNNLIFYEITLTTIRWSVAHLNLIKTYLLQDFNHVWTDGVDDHIWQNAFCADSPDFIGYECISNDVFAGEIKCAYGLRDPKTYERGIPYWYYAQSQLHMLVRPDIQYCFFVSWSPTRTKIWRINKDLNFWTLALRPLVYFHKCGLDKKPPRSLIQPCKKLIDYCELQCQSALFLGEFKSCFSKE